MHICNAIRWMILALLLVFGSGPVLGANLEVPRITPVPATSKAPLSSAERPGTEYADLAAAGYVEEEYYLHGVAPAITAKGEELFQVPYITRILVRKPKDPARFNGTVVIEPFTWLGERGTSWILTRNYLLRRGYAYVGYTLSMNEPDDPKQDPKIASAPDWGSGSIPLPTTMNLDFMRRFDFARYAPLGMYFDERRFRRGEFPDPFIPQSQAVGAQLALLLKSNATHSPLQGLKVERLYVNSWAVSAQVWMDYLNQGRHEQWRLPNGGRLVDAYMTGKMTFGDLGSEVVRFPTRPPNDAPFVHVHSQSEFMWDLDQGIPAPVDSDTPRLRFYELLGVPHMRPADLGTGEAELMPADIGKENDPTCGFLYDEEPEDVLASALLDAMDAWVRENKPMPRAKRVVRDGKKIVRDPKTRNLIGGVRAPWISVPAAAYMNEQETHCGLLYDTKIRYSAKQLRSMYGSYENYLRRFDAAKAAAIEDRYLLPEDADGVKPIAKPADFRDATSP